MAAVRRAVLLLVLASFCHADPTSHAREFIQKGTSKATNHWAVLVDTSRFWFNYRHAANALSLYRNVKRMGIPDSNIILMLADDTACSPRNPFPGTVYNDPSRSLDLYGESVEVDYRGYDVTVENFLRILTGRHEPGVPRSKRLLSDEGSNIFIYMTGHGGDEFLKFQDASEISSRDIADAFAQMHTKKRYNEIFFMIDTCQAGSFLTHFYAPGVLGIGSSRLGENSYALSTDQDTGVATIDRFTYQTLQMLEKIDADSSMTMQTMFQHYNPAFCHSNPQVRSDLFQRPLDQVLLTDFFAASVSVQVGARSLELAKGQELPRSHLGVAQAFEAVAATDGGKAPVPLFKLGSLEPAPVISWIPLLVVVMAFAHELIKH